MDAQTPDPPAEAEMIRKALRRARLSGREAARRAGLSETRWRQIASGYQDVGKGVRVPTQAPDDTLVRVAQVLGIPSDDLRSVGRDTAAELLDELAGPPTPASTPTATGDSRIAAIATLLADLPPEAQEEVLRQVGLAGVQPAQAEKPADEQRRRVG